MRQELFHHANRPAQIDFNLSSDVFEASSFVVNIDLTHDAGVVDQNVELGKFFGDLFVKSGDRFRIGNVASKGVNVWKGRFRTVHLGLIAARDKNRVTKCRELFGEFVTDATGTTGDQNSIAREFHNKIPPKVCGHLQIALHVDETAQKVDGRSSNKRRVSSINFVNAAGLRAQDSAFVGLSNFACLDRNHADEELGKLRFGFFQHRGTHHIDTQSLRKLNCGSPNKSFQRARNGCTRDTGEDRVVIENARNQGERSPFVDERDRLLDQTDLAHELAPQRKLPLFSGEFRKRSKCDFTCCTGQGIKRADGLIKLPDTFAVLDLDLEIA